MALSAYITTLKNLFGAIKYPITKTRAVYDDNNNRLDQTLAGINSDITTKILRGNVTFGTTEQTRDVIFPSAFSAAPTVVASFVGTKNDVRAQVANSSVYVAEITTTSCKLHIDRAAQTANVVVNYIAIGDIGTIKNSP